MTTPPGAAAPAPISFRLWRALLWFPALPAFAWALLVAWYRVHPLAAAGLAIAGVVLARKGRRRVWPAVTVLALALAVIGAWLALPAQNDRTWTPDVSQAPWAEINGDVVTLHNYRNFDWRSEHDFTPHWETRTFRLSQLQHLDFILTYWGSPHMGHTMVTFDFGPDGRLCASIEARREPGEHYHPLPGLLRKYELIYVLGDERDLVRLRALYRANNDVYLYRIKATPDVVRTLFLDYVATINALRKRPAWYNTFTTNCTTTIRRHVLRARIPYPWDWRILLNGHVDEGLHQFDYIHSELPLAELKRRSHINAAAREAEHAPDFSARIRAGRPGF